MTDKFSFDCECGKCKMALLDGYGVGDRLLEDVMFEVSINDGEMTIRVSDEGRDYFSELNVMKWLKKIAEDAVQEDNLQCSLCGGDVAVVYDGKYGYEYHDPAMLAKKVRIDTRGD